MLNKSLLNKSLWVCNVPSNTEVSIDHGEVLTSPCKEGLYSLVMVDEDNSFVGWQWLPQSEEKPLGLFPTCFYYGAYYDHDINEYVMP